MSVATSVVHRILPRFNNRSEFPTGDVPWFNDACGPDAILVGMNQQSGTSMSDAELYSIRQEMIGRGLFKPGGCTLTECKAYVIDKGYQIISSIPTGGSQDSMHMLLRTYAGLYPSVVFLTAAHNLIGTEQGVNGHFVDIGGIDSINGYWTANGDDVMALAVNNGHGKVIPSRWQSWQTLLNAGIDGLFFFARGNISVSGIPSGWTDTNNQLIAPAPYDKNIVVLGFREWILNHNWDALDVPLEVESGHSSIVDSDSSIGVGTRQTFRYSRLGYTTKAGVFRIPVGQDLLYEENPPANVPVTTPVANPAVVVDGPMV